MNLKKMEIKGYAAYLDHKMNNFYYVMIKSKATKYIGEKLLYYSRLVDFNKQESEIIEYCTNNWLFYDKPADESKINSLIDRLSNRFIPDDFKVIKTKSSEEFTDKKLEEIMKVIIEKK